MAKEIKPQENQVIDLLADQEVKEFFADPKAGKFQKCVRAVIQTMQAEEQEKTKKELEDAAKKKPKGLLDELFGS